MTCVFGGQIGGNVTRCVVYVAVEPIFHVWLLIIWPHFMHGVLY